jgi:N-acetylmuramoyl-L-alanine amidase
MLVLKLNKKVSFFILLLIIIILLNLFVPIIFSSTPTYSYIVVIDAGHGGLDGGSQGISTQNYESDLNLSYSMCLKEYFENFNFKVVMTRSTKDGLYSSFATNKKKSEMQAREKIIKSSNANLVVSIHMNSFHCHH